MPMAMPISTREPKRIVKQSVAKPFRRIVASESTNQKPRHTTRKLYEHKFLGTVKFGNDQIAQIHGFGDLVQGAVTIKRVYYVEGLNHNLFSVGQFCDADLEVAFRNSTCYIRDLNRNDLLTGSRGTDLYSITLQDTSSPNPICLMAKVTSSQAWLWHHRLFHLNFDTINSLSKNDIVIGIPTLKFIKYRLCSSCEVGKAKRKSFQTKTTPSSKRRLQLLHMDLCGPKRVERINGNVLIIVDDYSRYTWTHFLRDGENLDKTKETCIFEGKALAQSSSAVASLCISSGNLFSLAVGSCSGSGNSSLLVGMPCAFYSQQSSPKLDAPTAIKFPEENVYLERMPSIILLSWTTGNLVYL
nr:retrovirus-related Pol polyprotein from transposon TNT 1-94 [Tanacetum cinerariifolium]